MGITQRGIRNLTAEHKADKYFAVIGDCLANKYNGVFFLSFSLILSFLDKETTKKLYYNTPMLVLTESFSFKGKTVIFFLNFSISIRVDRNFRMDW